MIEPGWGRRDKEELGGHAPPKFLAKACSKDQDTLIAQSLTLKEQSFTLID